MSPQDDSARYPVRPYAERWTAESPFTSEAAEEQAPIDPWYQGYTPFVEGLEEMYAPEAEWESEPKVEFVVEEGLRLQGQGLQSLLSSQECQKRLKSTSVAVVGGGLAGLMAARELGQRGIKVTVFEARSQVGGRVLSNRKFSNGRITEEGAELIGSFHTEWLALAQKYGLACISRMDHDLYWRECLNVKLTLDEPLSMKEIDDLWKLAKTQVLMPIAQLASQIRYPSEPWLESGLKRCGQKLYDMQQLDGMSVADALAQCYGVKRDGRLWKAMEFMLVNNEVAPLDEMNFLGLLCKVKAGQGARCTDDKPTDDTDPDEERLMGYWNELEIFRCADGCQELANKMAEEIQTKYGAKLLDRTAVTNIDLSPQGVVLGSRKVVDERTGKLADRPLPLLTRDYVILAIPPSVWAPVTITAPTADGKKKKVNLDQEVGVIGMGPAVKFFSDVKERFWIKEKPNPSAPSRGSAPSGGSLKLGQVWEGTDNQMRVGNQGIVLSVFAGPIIPPTVAGGADRRAPNPGEFDKELRKLYPSYPRNLKTLFSDWPTVPFIKTGYASPRKGDIFKLGEKLSEPFRDRLFFAGEHTHMAFFGYMEGALRSGKRAANKLMQQSCGLLKKPAPASSEPPMRIASAAPIRANTASEYETNIPLNEHSSTDYPGVAESLFVGESEQEWEPRAAALASESPFLDTVKALEERSRSAIVPEVYEEESNEPEAGGFHEEEYEYETDSEGEHQVLHAYEEEQGAVVEPEFGEFAELKETEGLESDEEELDWLTEDSGEEEAAEDDFDAGPGGTALEERQLPAPKDTELRHFHVKKTLNVAGSLDTAAKASLMKPLEMGPAYIDPWLDTLQTDTSATGLQGLLSELMLGRWRNFLSPESVRDKKAHATDKLYVALVDLTGAKLSKPEFAGWAPTEAVDGASIPKILAHYALFQLRFDLNHLALANSITKKADLLKRAENHWKSTGLAGRPSLGRLFNFVEASGKPVQVRFQRWLDAAQFDINGNCGVTRLMNGLGFDYIGSVALQSGLRHPARGGLWLGTTYECGDTKATRWRRDPVPLIASCVAGDKTGHHITALSAATYYTLLAQGRLVDEPSSRELMTRLEYGCSLDPGGFHNGLQALGGVRRTAQKCGLLRKCTHESMFVERDRFRYVAVALAKGGGVPFDLLIQDLDKIIQKRNP